MPREHVDELYTAYLDGTLTEAQGREVQAHLDACPRCAAGLEEIRALVLELQALPETPAPAQFAAGVRARLGAQRPPRRRWLLPVFATGSVALAASLMLLIAHPNVTPPQQQAALPPRPTPVVTPAPSRLPAAPKTLPGPEPRIAIADARQMLNAIKQAPAPSTPVTPTPSMHVTTHPPQVVAAVPSPTAVASPSPPVMADRTQVAMARPSLSAKSIDTNGAAVSTLDKPDGAFTTQTDGRVDTDHVAQGTLAPQGAPSAQSEAATAAAPTVVYGDVPKSLTLDAAVIDKAALAPAKPQLALTVDAPAQGALVFRARDAQATLTVTPMPSLRSQAMRGVAKDAVPAHEARVERATLANGGMVLATVFTRNTAESYYLIVPDNGKRRTQMTLRAGKQAVLPVLRDIANAVGQFLLCPSRFAEHEDTLAAATAAPLDALRKLATQAHYALQTDGPVITVTPE